MLPVIHGRTMHFPRVPTPTYQEWRGFRVRFLALVAQVPLHPYWLTPAQAPRMSPIASVLDRPPTATMRALFPVPRRPLGQLSQLFQESFPTLNDVQLCLPPDWLYYP